MKESGTIAKVFIVFSVLTTLLHPSVTDPMAPFFSQGKFNIFHGGRQKPGGIENFSWGIGFFYKGDF